jgi:preprotein translocase subunit SecG
MSSGNLKMSSLPMSEAVYEKYAWVLLFVIQILILLVLASGPEGPAAPGSALHAFFSDNVTESTLELRLRGTAVAGMAIFGLAIILKSYRKGEKWAWYVLWYYPVFFAIHIVAFGTFLPDIIFLVISLLGLLLPYRKFFPKKQLQLTT